MPTHNIPGKMLYAHSYKIESFDDMFFITKCISIDFKMGSKAIKCNNQSLVST